MSEVHIRRATADDVRDMARIVVGWEEQTPWMESPYSVDEIAAMISDALGMREMWVAGDPIQGYLSYDPKARRVGGLYCKTTGAGIGKALMDRVKQGRQSIWLHTHEPNTAAQRFYRREGFVEVSRHAPEPPDTLWEIRMEWQG